jgi:hypothetical protein
VVVVVVEHQFRVAAMEAQDPLLLLFINKYHVNIRMICVNTLTSYKS